MNLANKKKTKRSSGSLTVDSSNCRSKKIGQFNQMAQPFQQPFYSEQNESPSTINFEEEPSEELNVDSVSKFFPEQPMANHQPQFYPSTFHPTINTGSSHHSCNNYLANS